jgi:hypothetical protein
LFLDSGDEIFKTLSFLILLFVIFLYQKKSGVSEIVATNNKELVLNSAPTVNSNNIVLLFGTNTQQKTSN